MERKISGKRGTRHEEHIEEEAAEEGKKSERGQMEKVQMEEKEADEEVNRVTKGGTEIGKTGVRNDKGKSRSYETGRAKQKTTKKDRNERESNTRVQIKIIEQKEERIKEKSRERTEKKGMAGGRKINRK